jgi:periplasmic protein TonB
MYYASFIKGFCAIFLILLISSLSFAAKSSITCLGEDEYKVAVDNVPVPVGGYESIMRKIVYPDMALKTRVEGKVYIMVYLDETGSVNDAKLVRGIGCGCDEEALRIVKKSKFIPATVNGSVSKAKFALALSFKLPG